jgi:O-antigen/teichoic acid export membrane protein
MNNFYRLLTKIENDLNQQDIVRNAKLVFSSFFLRTIFQSLYFVVLARTLGSRDYGSFLGIIAFVSLFIPFSNWGAGIILVQNVSRDQRLFGRYYGAAILKTLLFGSLFTTVVLVFSVVSPIATNSVYLVFLLAISNFIFMTLADNCRDAFTSMGLLKYTSNIILLLSFNRFLGAVIFVLLVQSKSVLIWAIIYCVATLITAVISSIMVLKFIGKPIFEISMAFKDLRQGFSFAISNSAENIYNDLDKAMLSKLSTSESVGIYGAAYHILNVAFLPIQSLMLATFRDFFRMGALGIHQALVLSRKVLLLSFSYSILGVIAILLFSPLISKVLGSEYAESSIALMWLSPTLLFKSLHRLAADILTGSNYQQIRTRLQLSAAFLNAALNFLLISKYQWYGAIWATLISECLLAVSLWGFVYIFHKREKRLI